MPRIDVGDGVELYHEDFGDGPPVVFVHGGAATHAMWDHQVHHLSDRFRTITYDHRGVGQSDKPRTGYTVDQLADDLAGLVRGLELPVGEVTLVSHGHHAQANWDLVENWLYHADPGEPMKIAHLQMALAWPLHVLRTLMQDLPNADHRSYLSQIRQPTLVLHGRHDRKNRFEGSQFLNQALPNARLVVFDDSAHCPYVEELDVYNATLTAFASSSMSSNPVASPEQERS